MSWKNEVGCKDNARARHAGKNLYGTEIVCNATKFVDVLMIVCTEHRNRKLTSEDWIELSDDTC